MRDRSSRYRFLSAVVRRRVICSVRLLCDTFEAVSHVAHNGRTNAAKHLNHQKHKRRPSASASSTIVTLLPMYVDASEKEVHW